MSDRDPDEPFSTFEPRKYLAEYYGAIGSENDGLLRFYAGVHARIGAVARALEVGGGPVIYALLSASRRVGEIHFTDTLQVNLDEVRRVLDGTPDAFDWRPYVRRAIEHEGAGTVTDEQVAERLGLVGRRVTRLLRLDLWECGPATERYDVVQSNFVLDSITSSLQHWKRLLAVLVDRVAPNGHLVLCALEGSKWWRLGERQFPAVPLDAALLERSLAQAGMRGIEIERIHAETPGEQGYSGILCAHAVRSAG